ncbi:non-canonical purine NTP pyrophosphatase [Qipengyuania sp. MTN3-11]|uniref:non-canonical purine NTP pyrophosphatase n=1 Tax=Qipengyuania sp. MTN3-11 TaxID=3056557 RepID=UPI0036F27F77
MIRKLTFFTGNHVKLAHARYIAEQYPISIVGFRERTYHAGYHEPRLTSRDEIFEASYESAKGQFAKAKLSPENNPFILEDTSVKIHALSTEATEVPGVDIKYWMRETGFAAVDAELNSRGRGRAVEVRSDILLHVPENKKRLWGVNEPFLTFTGTQSGHIVNSEQDFDTNLVFPWLDNQTFNKWFVPTGSDCPLGALPIDQADKYDFRRKAFAKLFQFLASKGEIAKSAEQMSLPLETRPQTILFCGPTCAGKTTASQYLAQHLGFLHLEASDFMHLSYHLRHGYEAEIEIGDFAESALAQKPLIAAEKVVEFIRQYVRSSIVVSGFRAPDEVVHLEDEMKVLGRELQTIFIEATPAERFERMKARMRPGDIVSFERFCRRDLQQERMGLSKIAQLSGVTKLPNHRAIPDFYDSVGAIAEDGKLKSTREAQKVDDLREVGALGLEEAILLTLLKRWDFTEDRTSFTTTEIANLIAADFPKMPAKHKDNVSRFFNQEYSPLFEVDSQAAGGARRFRLSNTGFGIASQLLREQLSN